MGSGWGKTTNKHTPQLKDTTPRGKLSLVSGKEVSSRRNRTTLNQSTLQALKAHTCTSLPRNKSHRGTSPRMMLSSIVSAMSSALCPVAILSARCSTPPRSSAWRLQCTGVDEIGRDVCWDERLADAEWFGWSVLGGGGSAVANLPASISGRAHHMNTA